MQKDKKEEKKKKKVTTEERWLSEMIKSDTWRESAQTTIRLPEINAVYCPDVFSDCGQLK